MTDKTTLPPWQTMEPLTEDKSEILRLRCLLAEAMDTRAPDFVNVGYPGWSDRVRRALGR